MLLHEIGRHRAPRRVGRTVEGLQWLAAHRFAIQRTWALDATRLTDDQALEGSLQRAIDPAKRYTVRLAREAVDGEPCVSVWGDLLATVAGIAAVARSVRKAAEKAATTDRPSRDADDEEPEKPTADPCVLVQEAAPTLLFGIAYSADPITALDETVIDITSAKTLVPERWVRKWGVWKTSPQQSDTPIEPVERVAEEVAAIGRSYGYPVRVEWGWDGERIVYGGLREASTIEGANFYTRRILEKLAPEVLSPLVWTTALPILGQAWLDVLQDIVGPVSLDPDDLARTFYHRAYADAGALGAIFDALGLPRESLEPLALGLGSDARDRPRIQLTARSLARTPRAVAFACRNLRLEPKVRRELHELGRRLDSFVESTHPEDLTARQIEEHLEELTVIVGDAARIDVTATIASGLFDHLLERALAPLGMELQEMKFGDRDNGMEGIDPGPALDRLHSLWEALPPGTRSAVAGGKLARVHATKAGAAMLAAIDEFLAVYGHFSDSRLDLAQVPWREDVKRVMRMVASRQAPASRALAVDRDRLAALGGKTAVLRAFDRAATWRNLEAGCASAFSRAYVALRPLLRRSGDILVRRGWLDHVDDVFMLTRSELADAAAFRIDERAVREIVAASRASMATAIETEPPDIVFGDDEPVLRRGTGERLAGIPVAGGYAIGHTVLVADGTHADRVGVGDVAILADSDVDPTAMLERAAAVVIAEGGFESAAAVACRAHVVPAIVVPGCCDRIAEGATIALDGFTGAIDILESEEKVVALTHGAAS